MLHKSIRFRIQFWHSLLLAITTIGLSVSYYLYEKQNRIRLVDNALHSESARFITTADRYLADRFPELLPRPAGAPGPQNRPAQDGPNSGRRRPPPNGPDGRNFGPQSPLEERAQTINRDAQISDTLVYGWDKELNLIFRTENATLVPPQPSNIPENTPKRHFVANDQTRVLLTKTLIGSTIGLAKDIRHIDDELDQLALSLIAIDLFVILLGISVGWQLTGRAIRPIHHINETAKQIADGQRDKRIDATITDSEISQLANVLNETFDKLDHSFEQQVKFTADASHELRTPVAALLTQIQLALSRDRSVEEYKDHLQACQSQAVRMRNLLNSLLDLARSDSGEIEYQFANYDLSELILECCEWLESLAAEKGVTFKTDLAPATTQIDGLRIGQVITNILSNAIRHSPPNSRITISLTKENDNALILIADQGSGVPEEARNHIFERFYRASKSRTSSQGSVGLGLAIAKSIVDKHQGEIAVNSDSSGATFTISLPLAR